MIKVESLVIHITDVCNMGCAHCLRGDAQKRYMDTNLIPNIFKGISEVDSLVFSGGEPSMYPGFITTCVDYIINMGIPVHGCYVVTNAKKYCQEIVDNIKRLLFKEIEEQFEGSLVAGVGNPANVQSPAFVKGCVEEFKYAFGIAVSLDNYHDPISAVNYAKYLASGIYDTSKEFDFSKGGVIARGRGAGLAKSMYREISELTIERGSDECIYVTGVVYIACDGRVYGDCDLDYDSLDYVDSYGDVSEMGLSDIFEKYVDEHENVDEENESTHSLFLKKGDVIDLSKC